MPVPGTHLSSVRKPRRSSPWLALSYLLLLPLLYLPISYSPFRTLSKYPLFWESASSRVARLPWYPLPPTGGILTILYPRSGQDSFISFMDPSLPPAHFSYHSKMYFYLATQSTRAHVLKIPEASQNSPTHSGYVLLLHFAEALDDTEDTGLCPQGQLRGRASEAHTHAVWLQACPGVGVPISSRVSPSPAQPQALLLAVAWRHLLG